MHKGGSILNIKATTKYQLNDYKKSIKIYYFVIILIIVFFSVLDKMWGNDGDGAYNGFETSTAIFLFICGLNSFKGTFLMMIQNGVSRKSMFIGGTITILTTSMVMAVLDRFISSFANFISLAFDSLLYTGLFDMLYSYRLETHSSFIYQLELFLVTWMVYIVATAVGYFITILYYRMNKALKIFISIGIPVSVLFILPTLDTMVLDGWIDSLIVKFFSFIFERPSGMILVCVLGSIIVLGLSWLLVRKAVDKN